MPRTKNSKRLSAREIDLTDKAHDLLNMRCSELKEMNDRLVLAIDGWRLAHEGQAQELKALRVLAYFAADPETEIGRLRAELAESRTAAANAEDINITREKQLDGLKEFYQTELHERERRIRELLVRLKKKRPKADSPVIVPQENIPEVAAVAYEPDFFPQEVHSETLPAPLDIVTPPEPYSMLKRVLDLIKKLGS